MTLWDYYAPMVQFLVLAFVALACFGVLVFAAYCGVALYFFERPRG